MPLTAAKYDIKEKNPHSRNEFVKSLPLGDRVSGLSRHGKQPHCYRALPRSSKDVTNQNAWLVFDPRKVVFGRFCGDVLSTSSRPNMRDVLGTYYVLYRLCMDVSMATFFLRLVDPTLETYWGRCVLLYGRRSEDVMLFRGNAVIQTLSKHLRTAQFQFFAKKLGDKWVF